MGRLSSTVGFTHKDWGSENKRKARSESVFGVYRRVMGRSSLPESKQYWTLAGMHSNEGCELPHALAEGIIRYPKQFHGVDLEKDVICHNREVHPGANWYQDEFTCALEKAESFNPGLINFDMVCMVEKAGLSVAQALFVLVDRNVNDVMMVANFLLNNPRENSRMCNSPTDIWEWFYRSSTHGSTIRRAMKRGWRVHTETYLYDGADKASNSYMQTVYFFRNRVRSVGV
jgi:hypothetical protein